MSEINISDIDKEELNKIYSLRQSISNATLSSSNTEKSTSRRNELDFIINMDDMEIDDVKESNIKKIRKTNGSSESDLYEICNDKLPKHLEKISKNININIKGINITRKELYNLFNYVDKNNDRVISRDEFTCIIKELLPSLSTEEATNRLNKVMESIDQEITYLNICEFSSVIEILSRENWFINNIHEGTLSYLIKSFDKENIDIKEIIKYFIYYFLMITFYPLYIFRVDLTGKSNDFCNLNNTDRFIFGGIGIINTILGLTHLLLTLIYFYKPDKINDRDMELTELYSPIILWLIYCCTWTLYIFFHGLGKFDKHSFGFYTIDEKKITLQSTKLGIVNNNSADCKTAFDLMSNIFFLKNAKNKLFIGNVYIQEAKNKKITIFFHFIASFIIALIPSFFRFFSHDDNISGLDLSVDIARNSSSVLDTNDYNSFFGKGDKLDIFIVILGIFLVTFILGQQTYLFNRFFYKLYDHLEILQLFLVIHSKKKSYNMQSAFINQKMEIPWISLSNKDNLISWYKILKFIQWNGQMKNMAWLYSFVILPALVTIASILIIIIQYFRGIPDANGFTYQSLFSMYI